MKAHSEDNSLLEHSAQIRQLAAELPLTRQYEMAAACEAADV